MIGMPEALEVDTDALDPRRRTRLAAVGLGLGSDVFYLFWSRNARASKEVEAEWRTALELKGLDFIAPVPLQSPRYARPPAELGALHFDDPALLTRRR